MLTVATLIAAGVGPTQARLFAEPLWDACCLFEIDTPARAAALVAQCRVESADFTRTEENLYYTSAGRIRVVWPRRVAGRADALVRNPQALANVVYANRLGNGDEASGDGWRYRGRGLIQLTGRDNYAAAERALSHRHYLTRPDLVAQPIDACLTAAWFWHSRGLNLLADAGQIDAITGAINGPARLEANRRRLYTQAAQAAFTA